MSLVPYKITAIKKTDPTGNNVLPLAAVSIIKSGGGFAQLWDNEAGTIARSNPFLVDENGERQVWLSGGEYVVSVAGGQSWDIKLTGGSDILSIENVAALSTFTPVPGQTYYLKEYHAGTGVGGGDLVGKAGAITQNNVTTFACAVNYVERLNYGDLTFLHAGAYGDGVATDDAAIVAALSTGKYVDGLGLTYGVNGTLSLPAVISMGNAVFKQLSPNDASRRTIYQNAGTFSYLKNITVDRNGNGTGGALGGAGGIWFSNCDNVVIDRAEVYGNDYGNGIVFIDCTHVDADRLSVHDIRAGDASAAVITDDKVQGIWIQRGSDIKLTKPRIENLRCQWLGQASTPKFTRGIAIGGASGVEIYSPYVYSVDQCIDITGDEDPTRIQIFGGHLLEGATWGLKCANSPTFVEVFGVIAEKCGNSGFVVSGPSGVIPTQSSKIDFYGCKAIGTGFDSGGPAGTNVGFRVTVGADIAYPQQIRFIDCIADDDSNGLMAYGFANDVLQSSLNTQNRAINCRSVGATTAAFSGFSAGMESYVAGRYYGGGYINPSVATTLALTANTLYAVPFRVADHWKFPDLNFVVSSGAAGSARLGIYSWENGGPKTLLFDAGTVSVASAGIKSLSLNRYLETGVYALAIVSDVAPTIYASSANIQQMECVGLTAIGAAATQISRAFAYGPLPAVFGAATYTTASVPNLILRA